MSTKYLEVRITKDWQDIGFTFRKGNIFSVNDGGYGICDLKHGGRSEFWYCGMYVISKVHSEIVR